jgi:hypothetical protein
MQAAIVGGDVSALKAREAFLAYRNLVKEGRATEDDELLMRAYRTIAQGKRVLDLRETFKISGLDEQLRPKLAIARADAVRVWFEHHYRMSRWIFTTTTSSRARAGTGSGKTVVVPRDVFSVLDGRSSVSPPGRQQWWRIEAVVPTIPAHLRPPTTALHGLHILWEAEWQPIAPKDPILLKRIGAYLYAVLAQWDLTELERAVLGARLS